MYYFSGSHTFLSYDIHFIMRSIHLKHQHCFLVLTHTRTFSLEDTSSFFYHCPSLFASSPSQPCLSSSLSLFLVSLSSVSWGKEQKALIWSWFFQRLRSLEMGSALQLARVKYFRGYTAIFSLFSPIWRGSIEEWRKLHSGRNINLCFGLYEKYSVFWEKHQASKLDTAAG